MSSSVPPRLFLVGTVHHDPRTVLILQDLLKNIRPDCITVEITPWSLKWRRRLGRRLRQRFIHHLVQTTGSVSNARRAFHTHEQQLRPVLLQLSLPPEWRAAKQYGLRHGVPVIPVDSTKDVQPMFSGIRGLVDRHNVKRLLEFPPGRLADRVRKEWLRCRTLHDGHRHRPCGMRERDRRMACRIRDICHTTSPERLMHIGGWEHMVPGPPALPGLLADLKPAIVFADPETDL